MRVTRITGISKDRAKFLLGLFGPDDLEIQQKTIDELRSLADLLDSGNCAVAGLELNRGPVRGQYAGLRSIRVKYYDNEE